MARNTNRRSSRTSVQSSDVAVGTGVHADSYARGRSEAALAAADISALLGTGAKVFQAETVRRNTEGFEKGNLDYLNGDIDADNENAGYLKAVEQNRAKRQFEESVPAWDAFKQENFDADASDDPAGDLNGLLDGFFKSQFGGLSDAEAKVVAPRMQALRNQENARLREDMLVRADEDIRAGLGATAADFLGGDGTFNHEGFIGEVKKVREGEDIWTAYVDSLTHRAVMEMNPSYLEDIPETLDGRGLPPKHREAIEATRAKVQDALDKQQFESEVGLRVQTYVGLDAIAETGSLTFAHVETPLVAGRITESEAQSLLTKSWNKSHEGDMSAAYAKYIEAGLGFMIPSKDQQGAMDAYLAGAPEEQLLQAATNRGVVNGIMWEPHKQLMKQASPVNPVVFLEAFETYKAYTANDPTFAAANVPERQQAQFAAYQHLRDAGMTDELALDTLRNFDPKKAKESVNASDWRGLIEGAQADVADIPWSMKEVANTPRFRNQVVKTAETLLGLGYLTPEDAVSQAVELLARNRVDVDGHLYHVNTGWPAQSQDAADWYKSTVIPAGEDPDDWELAADWQTQDTSEVVLIPRGEIPFGQHYRRVKIADLAQGWKEHQNVTAVESRRSAKAEVDNETKQRAIRKVLDVPAGTSPEVRLMIRSQRQQWFESLPAHEQDLLIEKEVAQENKTQARRQRRREQEADRFTFADIKGSGTL